MPLSSPSSSKTSRTSSTRSSLSSSISGSCSRSLLASRLSSFSSFPRSTLFAQLAHQEDRRTSKSYVEAFSTLNLKLSNALSCISLIKACSTEEREEMVRPYEQADRRADLQHPEKASPDRAFPRDHPDLSLDASHRRHPRRQKPEILRRISRTTWFFLFMIRRSVTLFGTFNVLRGGVATIRGALDQIAEVFSDGARSRTFGRAGALSRA